MNPEPGFQTGLANKIFHYDSQGPHLKFVLGIVEFDLHFRLHRHFQPYLRQQKGLGRLRLNIPPDLSIMEALLKVLTRLESLMTSVIKFALSSSTQTPGTVESSSSESIFS